MRPASRAWLGLAEASGEGAFVVGEVGGVGPSSAYIAMMVAAPHEELLAMVNPSTHLNWVYV